MPSPTRATPPSGGPSRAPTKSRHAPKRPKPPRRSSVDPERAAQRGRALALGSFGYLSRRQQGRAVEGAGELVQLDGHPGLEQAEAAEDALVAQRIVLRRRDV